MGGTLGFRETRWGRLAIMLFGVWSIFTCLVCFEKPDYINLTMAIIGLHLFLDPQQIKQSYLRALVFALPVSEIIDIIWLYDKAEEFWEDKDENGMS